MRNVMDIIFDIMPFVSIALLCIGSKLFMEAYNNPNKKKQENTGFAMTMTAIAISVVGFIICFGTTDGRAALGYILEYHDLRGKLENTNAEFGGITKDQYQFATIHNEKKAALHDTWITNAVYGINMSDKDYLIDLSEYKILNVET
jgi:hypothetical protein